MQKGGEPMDNYQLMIYGAGNSEIAERLEAEMDAVYHIRNPQLRIYARTYILANSCLAMYKRFDGIKDAIGDVKSSGTYEYTYEGGDSGIKTQQLHIDECSSPVTFEYFLETGIENMEGKEIILVLIGRSYGNGLFLDCCTTPGTQLTYEDFFAILKRVGNQRGVYFHLILDVGLWHSMILPYELSQIPSVASLFIWDSNQGLETFPIRKWIETSIYKGENWIKVLYREFAGYKIHTHSVWWKLCKMKWEAYRKNPYTATWRQFYEQYKDLIFYTGEDSKAITKPLHQHYELDYVSDETLCTNKWANYLSALYDEQINITDMDGWLKEMKNCIAYYKL